MAGKRNEPKFLAQEYLQKTPYDCLKTACTILSSELPEVDTGDWDTAIAILHGAGITARGICRPQHTGMYGGKSHPSEVLAPDLFFTAIQSHPGVLVIEEKTKGNYVGESSDHALASSGRITVDPRTGLISQYNPCMRIMQGKVKAAILFPDLNANRCEQRIKSMLGHERSRQQPSSQPNSNL